jgi:hypothetical protein
MEDWELTQSKGVPHHKAKRCCHYWVIGLQTRSDYLDTTTNLTINDELLNDILFERHEKYS